MHGHKYRARSPENVVAEFEYIANNFPDVKIFNAQTEIKEINEKYNTKKARYIIDDIKAYIKQHYKIGKINNYKNADKWQYWENYLLSCTKLLRPANKKVYYKLCQSILNFFYYE